MKKVIVSCIVVIIAIGAMNYKSVYFLWRYTMSNSPVTWENVEISFPERFMYEEHGDAIMFGDWMHIRGGLTFHKLDLSQAERTMERYAKEPGYNNPVRLLENYSGKDVEVLQLYENGEPETLVVFMAFKKEGLLAVYDGAERDFPLYKPILSGLKFLQ